ncbi:MAG: hypothetical protein A2170_09005 [Deltaproteobacteria bacterium RBG_13_53_10]|nr:MAG: hypothetical protein A2170_09005 [Deltaproteobacteria bacterium RBG_13_53_10]
MATRKTTLNVLLMVIIVIGWVGIAWAQTGAKKLSKPLKITMSGYSVGGASAVVGESIGNALKQAAPGSAFTYEPGQSGANEVTVASGKTELGLSHVWTTKAAMEGKEFYKQAYPNLRVIAYLHDTYATWVLRKDAGITSIEQIKEKKFPFAAGVNTKNSVMEALPRYGFEAYGMSYEDVEKWGGKIHFLASNPTFDLIRNKRAHAFLGSITPPYAAINELATTVDLVWLPMSDQAIQHVAKKMGGGKKVLVLKEWYPKFMTSDVPTVGVPNVLITRMEVPEEEIYFITKAIYDNLAGIHKASVQLLPMTRESIARDIGELPLHPGAEKFYREAGVPMRR